MTPARAPRVLVIDDDADLREAIAGALELRGYEVRLAANGAEALRLLRDDLRLPDAILLDLMMPVMDGAQFRAAQRSDPKLAPIPVALLTGHAEASARAEELDFEQWCLKPIDLQALLAIVVQLVEARADRGVTAGDHQPT
jgi:CheY-like chemotaxis protein